MPNLVENNAITVVSEHLRKMGYDVENVSKSKRDNVNHKGFDLIASKPGENPVKIEVKGCTRPWGIPDLYVTEFDSDRRLVADFLYVVYFINHDAPLLCVIPRDALKPEYIVPKFGYRISSRFKNKRSLAPYLKPL